MKNRIVVATDFSQSSLTALTKAMFLAKKQKYTLDVVHVVEYSIFHDPQKRQEGRQGSTCKIYCR